MKELLNKQVSEKVSFIDDRLKELVKIEKNAYQILFEAANYSLFPGGKRLRPLLTLLAVEAYKQPVEKAIDPACAIELIHTYSLIHDDLPCMDDDDERRNKPSLHKKYPEAIALLTGDYLLTYAFEVISKAELISSENRLELIRLLAQHSGADGMIGGQVLDMTLAPLEIDLPMLNLVYYKKTAALITLSLEFAAVICALEEKEKKRLVQFGKKFGLGFQIIDDILDYKQDSSKKETTVTAISFLGLVRSKKYAQQIIESALEDLNCLSCDITYLEQLSDKIIQRIY